MSFKVSIRIFHLYSGRQILDDGENKSAQIKPQTFTKLTDKLSHSKILLSVIATLDRDKMFKFL